MASRVAGDDARAAEVLAEDKAIDRLEIEHGGPDYDALYGGVHAVLYDHAAKILHGGADPRGPHRDERGLDVPEPLAPVQLLLNRTAPPVAACSVTSRATAMMAEPSVKAALPSPARRSEPRR